MYTLVKEGFHRYAEKDSAAIFIKKPPSGLLRTEHSCSLNVETKRNGEMNTLKLLLGAYRRAVGRGDGISLPQFIINVLGL